MDSSDIADTGNKVIRRLFPDGRVDTLAGGPGVSGREDGPGPSARFEALNDIALDVDGQLLVADGERIRRVKTDGTVSTLATASQGVRTGSLTGIAADGIGGVLAVGSGCNCVVRINRSGVVEVVGGNPRELSFRSEGSADGTLHEAGFTSPQGIVLNRKGEVLVADYGNNCVRRGTLALPDVARADRSYVPVGGTVLLTASPATGATHEWEVVRRPSGSVAQLSSTSGSSVSFRPDVSDLFVFRLTARSGARSSITLVEVDSGGQSNAKATLSGGGSSCRGESATLGATMTGSAPWTIRWSDGFVQTGGTPMTRLVSPDVTTTYSLVSVADQNGMGTVSGSATVEVRTSPARPLVTAPTTVRTDGSTYVASVEVHPGSSFAWSIHNGTIVSGNGTNEIRFKPVAAGPVTVSVVESAGTCPSPEGQVHLVAFGATADVVRRFVPVVLSVEGRSGARFTTELTFTNRGETAISMSLLYTAAAGGGSGSASETLPAGTQRVVPDAIGYLRDLGIPIPSGDGHIGTVLVTASGVRTSGDLAVTARTGSATKAPDPVGRSGLAYAAIDPGTAGSGALYVFGLRDDAADRSNVAIFNPTEEPVTVRVTVHSGDRGGGTVVVRPELGLGPHGWTQLTGILEGTGIVNGWAEIERVGGSGRFGAYGVVNDNATQDGSFVSTVSAGALGARITVPVLVETRDFESELVLANRSDRSALLSLSYVEALTPTGGAGGHFELVLGAREQLVVPNAISFLRGRGVKVGAKGAGSYAGALRVVVSGVEAGEVYGGARTAALSPSGGQFGTFTPGLYESDESSEEAFVLGLRADEENRSNLAIVNTGPDGSSDDSFSIQVFDGVGGGHERGAPIPLTLGPGRWAQITNLMRQVGVATGWVRVRRVSGTAPWIAYGVVNDGQLPGHRTGDGAYLPMTLDSAGVSALTRGDEIRE